jgi:hypothetical protein
VATKLLLLRRPEARENRLNAKAVHEILERDRGVAIGHQFWWEYGRPVLNVVTANELHVPISDSGASDPDIHVVKFGKRAIDVLNHRSHPLHLKASRHRLT